MHREAGGIEPGREEHRVAEAEQAGIADQDVVADAVGRQHHDAGEVGVMIGRQHELQQEEHRDGAAMERERAMPVHQRAFPPNRPSGRKISTSATSRVARIFDRLGEKNTEITPSLMPITNAAITAPRRLPRPPMMTTMKDSSSGPSPIR